MKRSHVLLKRLGLVLPMIVVLGSFLTGPRVGSAHPLTNETVFASVEAIGVAATPDRLLVTTPLCGNPRLVKSFDSAGNATDFATLPNVPAAGCREDYIAIAPPSPGSPGFPSKNLAGFVSNRVYVTQGPNIIEIPTTLSPTGTLVAGTPTLFVTIPSCSSSRTGITFDQVGKFGPHGTMIVTCNNGGVWKVIPTEPGAPTGDATFLATIDAFIEGPAVAPQNFTSCPGCLFVASPSANRVFSLSPPPSLRVRRVTNWPAAEGVAFVPSVKCDFRTSGGTFFTAIHPGQGGSVELMKIVKFPLADLSGLGGRALVTREFGPVGDPQGIALLTTTQNGVTVSTFHSFTPPIFPGQQGSSFVDCGVATLVKIDVLPGEDPNILNLRSGGLVSVVVFGSATFDTGKIEINFPVTPTFGITGLEQSGDHVASGRKDNNDDGFLDLEIFFRIPKLCSNAPCPPNMQQPAQWALKGKYLGPSGDPEFEAGD